MSRAAQGEVQREVRRLRDVYRLSEELAHNEGHEQGL
jgi:hypothetical protein